jgi:N-acetylmuramoyl-L-alanine amidase
VALPLQHPDASHRAAEANASEVDCYLDLGLLPEHTSCTTAYYKGFSYESLASKHLARLVQSELPRALGLADAGILGMSLPVLRETRMPAIEVRLGAPASVVRRTSVLAHVLAGALTAWVASSSE